MILLKGIILGLLIAAPTGPIGVLCIQRTLTRGRLSGFVSGLGAATADAFYGAVAAFGLVLISDFLIDQQVMLRLVGGLILIYIGISSLYKNPIASEVKYFKGTGLGFFGDYLSTLFLTLTNPLTVFYFLFLFSWIGFGHGRGALDSATVIVIGVFLGSTLWWLTLSFGVTWLKSRVENFSLKRINEVAGLLVVLSGLFILGQIFA